MFVSWKHNGRLRGCLGTFEPQPLGDGLRKYAIASASRDSRFRPITIDEIPELQVSVSLLTGFEEAEDHRDWIIGYHGIRIQFMENGADYKATFLPEIAEEQGWNHDETIRSLVEKSGFRGKFTDHLLKEITLTRYISTKISLTYREYLELV